jgi:hypothetical protein
MLAQQTYDRQHESRRAESALQPVALVESLLNGMERSVRRNQALDGRHLVPFGLHREHQARSDGRAVE